MALALADGICRAGLVRADQIVVSEPHSDARQRLTDRLPGVRFAETGAAAAAADLVILAVKPQHAAEACGPLIGHVRPTAVVVSIVAGAFNGNARSLGRNRPDRAGDAQHTLPGRQGRIGNLPHPGGE